MFDNEACWKLPKFEASEFNPKKNKYCICVFVINEGEKLLKQLEAMQSFSSQIDIVIADGGSSDGSTEPNRLKQLGVNTLLKKLDAGQLGTQMRMAFGWALQRGYKGVVCIDGNGKDRVDDITKFITKLDEGYDHIQGSRFIRGGHHRNTPLLRLLGIKIIHVPIMRLASGFPYTDTTNGFRAYSAKLLTDNTINLFRNVFTGYELHYYLAVKAPRLGFNCTEIAVSRRYPVSGKVPTKISPVKGNLQVISRLLGVIFGRYDAQDKIK